jgi:LCP family protein required for cell wall assembly
MGEVDRHRLRRVLVWSLACCVALAASYGGYVAWLYYDAQEGVKDPDLDPFVEPRTEAETPFWALLVGSDSREGLTEEEQDRLGAQDVNADGTPITGERADTLILARVDPEADHITMVQFPRDLYVTFPDGTTGKVNAALDRGRPFLVQTVESLTDVSLNQYAQVNISGFRDLVDAIGGVDVCFPEPVPFDSSTGFEVTSDEVGMVHLDGERALRYVRTRKVFAEGDFERIANQQKLLASAIQKVATLGTLFRPDRVHALFATIKESVRTDSYSSLRDLQSLAERFKVLSEDSLDVYVVPNQGTTVNEAGDVVVPATKRLTLLFSKLGSPRGLDPVAEGKLEDWRVDVPVPGALPPACRTG